MKIFSEDSRLKSQLSLPHLLIIDFTCAWAGGLLYYFVFDFLISQLGLPLWVASTQLIANLTYALFGSALFIFRLRHKRPFLFLTYANFAYAAFCLVVALILLNQGSILLLAEALVIFTLAKVELKTIRSSFY